MASKKQEGTPPLLCAPDIHKTEYFSYGLVLVSTSSGTDIVRVYCFQYNMQETLPHS